MRYFENGEDVPFAVEFRDSGAIDSDENGAKVFRVNADSSLKRMSASAADRILERRRAISKAWAIELAKMWESVPSKPAS